MPQTWVGDEVTDLPVTAFLATFMGEIVVVAGSLLLCGTVLLWASRPGHADRWPVALSAGAMGFIIALLNIMLGAAGIWQAEIYRLPLVALGALYLLMPIPFMALVLIGYRWLARHTRRPALVYALLLIALPPTVLVVDRWAIRHGYVAFGGGYTPWMDALLAMALFGTPVLLYETLRRAQSPLSLTSETTSSG